MRPVARVALSVALLAGALAAPAAAQHVHHHHHYHGRPWAANVVVPQARSFHAAAPVSGRATLSIEITGVEVGVVISEQVATTTMDIGLRNLTSTRQEAELVVPVPSGVAVRSFTFQGAAAEPTAELLPKEEAKSAYAAIVAKIRDPALLEFIGCTMIRSAVFPLEPNGTQKVRLTYEQVLAADGNRVDYEIPRTESLDYTIPWTVSVRIKSTRPVATVYSPTHALDVRRQGPGVVSVRIKPEAADQPGPIRLSYLTGGDGVAASLLAYPDARGDGGYFLLLAGVPATLRTKEGRSAIRREVILVLDRSGSMRGGKIDQVREAAQQVIEGLDDGEAFNVILYNETVEPLSPKPLVKGPETVARAREWLGRATPRGGTNLHDALVEALRMPPTPGALPIVLFLTDGLPTVGRTSEAVIRDAAMKANPHERRIFTFGAGVDVNTPLLEKIAAETRATSTFVLPGEDVEVKVGGVFKRLAGPVLAGPTLSTVDAAVLNVPGRVSDLVPDRLPDLFEDDQLVVLGRYTRGDLPLVFHLTGNCPGRTRDFRFEFDLSAATTRNAFVPRLWASRKIGVLLDAVRQMGAEGTVVSNDPKLKELTDEIVRLSTEFGILTEYTAFLAREGTDLSARDEVLAEAVRNFQDRAIRTRSGLGAVNQEVNNMAQRSQTQLNARNEFYDAAMNRVAVAAVQQVNDRAFYRRGGQWVDSRLVDRPGRAAPDRTITFGSPEFHELALKLARDHRAGSIALAGDILMVVDGRTVLVKAPKP